MSNEEAILECLMSALVEIKDDLPEFMQSDDMLKYLHDSWGKKLEELFSSRSQRKKIPKNEWRNVLEYVKQTIPLRYNSNPTKVSIKFGLRFLEELDNKQTGNSSSE